MEHKRSALESDYSLPHVKITVLIETIAKMSKNPSIDRELGRVLDQFLLQLEECDKYLEHGIFNMNFAEAALLIQNSADVYSKKVDLLWDIIFDYQKRLLMTEEQNGDKNQEIEKVEERKRKYKRKRKTKTDENESAKLVNSFSFGAVENIDYLNQDYKTIELSKEWNKFEVRTASDSTDSVSKDFNFLPDNRIHNEDNDYIGRYDQFHSMYLIDEIFHLQKQNLLVDTHNCVVKMRIDSYVINDFLLRKCIPNNQLSESYSDELKTVISNYFETNKYKEKKTSDGTQQQCCSNVQYTPDINDSGIDILSGPQLACKKSFVEIERLPFNVVRDMLRRNSVADSLFEEEFGSFSESCPEHSVDPKSSSDQVFEKVGSTLENRSKSCSQDSAFFEDGDHDDQDVGCSQVENSNVDSMDQAQITTCCQVENYTADDVDAICETQVQAQSIASSQIENTTEREEFSATSIIQDQQQGVKRPMSEKQEQSLRKISPIILELLRKDEPEMKKRRVQRKQISPKNLKALATGVTVDELDFERFCRQQYKAADGEGKVDPLPDPEESDEGEDNHEATSDEEEENQHDEPSDEEAEEATKEDEDNNENPNLPNIFHTVLSPVANATSSKTNEVDLLGRTSTPHRPIKSNQHPNIDFEADEECRKNVRQWRSFILPKLKSLENRQDFDIHEYGSRIIEPSEIGEKRYFKDIVNGKSAAEVSKYFIATLQLANTYNVEICGAIPNDVANDSFQIKTLDKTKHHELLEEYQAPSEQTFKERLERAKASTPFYAPSTSTDPPAKRRKFANLAGRTLF